MELQRLTKEQKNDYEEKGYVIGLSIFNAEGVAELNHGLQELSKLLKSGETHFHINAWHNTSRWLYHVCTHPQILNYVEDILGPNFYLWGSHFFSKAPRSKDTVGWHQDAPAWPLKPHKTVTVWLAFQDADEENGAMKVIPGTHKSGLLQHTTTKNDTDVLKIVIGKEILQEKDAVSFNMKAGQMSLHDDALVHGSPANISDRWRQGFTMRFSATDVKCDMAEWPEFSTHIVRGIDEYRHNPVRSVPEEKYARYDFNPRYRSGYDTDEKDN